jgi:hypothetical protein
MAITRARTSSVAQGPSTRKTVLGGNDVILGGSYDAIGTYVVGSEVPTVTFSSIPGTYKHLQVRGIANNGETSGYNNQLLRFNGDTGSNYAVHYVAGNGSSASASGSSSATRINDIIRIPPTSTGHFGGFVIDILDYANTNKYKTVRSLNGGDSNGSGWVGLHSGLWMSTTAITSMTFISSSGNFGQYSSFDLYGIK